MHSDKIPNPETLETQIAVIGAGGAGLAASVAAAEMGADVILLEKYRRPGGNSALAMGIFAAESPVQKRMKIDAKRDELFKQAMRFASWKINPKIVRAFIDKSGDTIRWLEEKGLNFDIPTAGVVNPLMTWHCPDGFGRGHGALIVKALAQNFKDLGGQLLYETPAKKILMGNKGEAIGVLATRKGKKFRITASSVIIATGGYGGNKRLLRKYCPYYNENIHLGGFPNMGDGLMMALKIGAATEDLGILQLEAACYVPGETFVLMVVAQQPYTLWVNKKGERFIDEAFITQFNMFEAAFAVIRQPDYISYTIFDERIKQILIEGEGTVKAMMGIPPGTRVTDLANLLQSAAERGHAKISDSWDDIARWMGATPETLKATIDEYNSFCDQGYDKDFIKDCRYLSALRTPPYYALKCLPRFIGTVGGIKINHHMEVVDSEDKPIPGVYAVGIDAGGWEPETYNQNLAGSAYGFAVNSGRIAGENAAKYVLGK